MQHLAVHVQPGLEVGGVGDGHLDEDDVAVVGQVVVRDDLADLVDVLLRVAGVGLVGDQPDGAAGAVAHEPLRRGVEVDLGRAQLEGAAQPRDQTETAMMAAMKQAPIFTPSGPLDHVVDRRVDEDQRRSRAKPSVRRRWPARRAARVTATAAEVISTSTPVA